MGIVFPSRRLFCDEGGIESGPSVNGLKLVSAGTGCRRPEAGAAAFQLFTCKTTPAKTDACGGDKRPKPDGNSQFPHHPTHAAAPAVRAAADLRCHILQ